MTTRWTRREAMAIAAALAIPADLGLRVAAAQNPSSPGAAPATEPAPDLGNLHETIEWIAKENSPRLSFLDAKWKSLDDWKRAARPVYQQHLSYDPNSLPPAAEIVGREDRDGFAIETVRIKATPAYDIPARVLIPSQRSGRVPGVLALHCHSGQYAWGHEKILSTPGEPTAVIEFRDRVYGRPYAEVLSRKGYVVLVIDAFYFGERRLKVEDIDAVTAPGEMKDSLRKLATLDRSSPDWLPTVNNLCGRYEQLVAKTVFAAGATWPGMLTWDDQRSLDYLCSRGEVDPQRIGCLGLSIGGLRTARLIGLDPRIKAACVTGWMTQFGQQLKNHLRGHTWMAYVPGLYSSLDLPDVAALTAPGALLVQQCSRDTLYPMAGMKGAVDQLSKIYEKAGISERFRGTFYDEPHCFRPAMQDEAFAWLERWL
jgi:dienelactone hydrolase